MTLLMFMCIYYLFLLPPVGFLFLAYKIGATISAFIKHISLLVVGFIYVTTAYSLVTAECHKVEANGQIKLQCVEILGKNLGASFGAFLGLIILSQVWARCKPTEEPNLMLSMPDGHPTTMDCSSAQNILHITPQAQIKTVPHLGSAMEDLPPSYWSVVRARELDYSEINIPEVKNDLNKETYNDV